MNKSAAYPFSQQPPMSTARANAELNMCDKCIELDAKIENYQRLSSTITDQRTHDGIKELIERMQAQKAALHPPQTE
jgi:hypothetical protein